MSTVDILIPAYNSAHFLPGALESVLSQTFEDWHIQLVDDGSNDDTRAVVERFLAEHRARLTGRLSYLYQENRGLPAARNTGIRNGAAPLLALLDADDRWLPNRLEEAVRSFAERPEAGVSYGGVTRFREEGVPLDTFVTSDPGTTREQTANRLYTRAVHFPCPTVTFRREAVERVGLFDETMRATEDRDLWLRIAEFYPAVFIPRVVALYRLSSGSMSADLPRMLAAQTRFIQKHAGKPGCGPAAQRVALAGVYGEQAERYTARRQFGQALRFAAKAVRETPTSARSWRAVTATLLRATGLRRS